MKIKKPKIKLVKTKSNKQEAKKPIGKVTPKPRSPLTRSAKKPKSVSSTTKKKKVGPVVAPMTYVEATAGLDLAEVRQWARKEKYTVGDRGRIPIDVLLRYRDAH